MKVGQNPDLLTAVATAASNKQASKSAEPAATEISKSLAPKADAGVPVSFSTSARALDQTGRSTTDFDANRVKAMKEAIANGTFTVNAGAVADKLLDNTQEFLSHSSSSPL
jgi:negative regulator of flagellin synthesis FlgM